MLNLQQNHHHRTVALSISTLLFGYFAIWLLLSEFFSKGAAAWTSGSNDIYLVTCCVLMICTVSMILIKSFQDTKRLEKVQLFDSVTDLPNSDYLKSQLANALKDATTAQPVGLMMVGMKRLDSINDSVGKDATNQVIKSVVERLRSFMDSDKLLVRFSENQFGILFNPLSDTGELAKTADTIFSIAKSPIVIEGVSVFVDFTIGATSSNGEQGDAEEILWQVGLAHVQSMDSAAQCLVEYSGKLASTAKRQSKMEIRLREALEANEIELHFQPLISHSLNSVYGVEALARWEDPELGNISPSEFVGIAETLGLAAKLGNVILRKACESISVIPGLNLAVNISPDHFFQPEFLSDVDRILKETGFDPNNLEIEITENVLMESADRANQIVSDLRRRGISIALDDFGTGYSGLSYLNQFDVDRIKIDAKFIQEIDVSDTGRRIFSSILNMIKIRGFDVTVEGIENIEQAKYLGKFGELLHQGFLYSKPLPLKDLIALDIQDCVAEKHETNHRGPELVQAA